MFHYRLPATMEPQRLEPGARLLVPFGRSQRLAFFVRRVDQPDVAETKEVLAVLDGEASIPRRLFDLLLWITDYYLAPMGAVIKGAFPQGIHAVVCRHFDLTEEGKQADREKRASLQEEILSFLDETGSQSEPDLRKRFAAPSLPRSLSLLKKKGWITERWEVMPPAVRKKFRRSVSLLEAADETASVMDSLQRRAPQQAQVIEILRAAGGSLPVAAFEASLRAPLKRLLEKGLIGESQEAVSRIPRKGAGFPVKGELLLNAAQQGAVDQIVSTLEEKKFAPFLLHGITGSGKTEVYLRAIEKAVSLGRGAILLVPEIGLTAQLVARFHSRFGEAVALFHSGLSPGERYDEWSRVREGKAQIAIGVRSAIFAPFEEVGIIIVDEEHDASYKQEDGVHYHARDMALVRAKQSNAVVVLGSATPSFESFHNSQTGKYRYLHLPGRIDARPLPTVKIIDLRKKEEWVRPFLTRPLISEIGKRLDNREQAMIFINRRGFSPALLCGDCGYLPYCIRCSVSLTYHKKTTRLVCHYCGFQMVPPAECPECQGVRLIHLGIGTEQVEEELRKLFPAARIARLDRDTTQKKEAHHKILAAMAQREIDLLVGTQMIAKGHDFPQVTLVGVLCADLSLHFPDFRAAERTFQLLAQVSGRAGRGERPGEVMIQTFQPQHDAIAAAAAHDYSGFYEREIAFRKEMGYPPFYRLTLLLLSHVEEARVADRAAALGDLISQVLPPPKKGDAEREVSLLGPAPAPLARLRGEYRYQILLKGKEQRKIAAILKESLNRWKGMERKGVRLEVNIDPQNFV
ncbi:MAG: primosomal protein N' [Nitrospirae bacterium]|nr:primosomal protein N' [Candidatus Manganitrophaceae bacterium]